MQFISKERATTAIYVRIKRGQETYFILCDEYWIVDSLKMSLLSVLKELNFTLPRMDEELTTEDIRLCCKNRVSFNSHRLRWLIHAL